MDALTGLRDDPTLGQSGDGAAVAVDPSASMPAETPLSMPVQSLYHYDTRTRHKASRLWVSAKTALARLATFGGALAITVYGTMEMYEVVAVGGVTPLEWALVFLFVINFSWIALACTSALVGFLTLAFRPAKLDPLPTRLSARTAVVMPIYNEAPARVFGTLQAIYEEVQATGLGANFDWFMLSDTTDPEIFVAEEQAFIAMRERLGPMARFFYRHRQKNTARKAGNISDFVTTWGGAYAHMVVLDADSLMTGHSIATLAAAMEADPDSGIIQTLPLIINRNTLFARVQQFAARIYGPVIAAGLSAWMGRDGNYWGHNAIIRTKAFADHCGLPLLRGRPPFGGHILSHDFVEAALIRRAGYAVYMLPNLGGSYEESPPSLIDLSARDRRWCQGNLQHVRVLPAKGLHWASRQHFVTGIMGYLTSPSWMLQLIVGIVLVFQASYIRPEYFSNDFTLFPAWPRFDAEKSLELFATTMFILLMPKAFGLLLALLQGPTRRGSGGAIRLVISAVFEIIMSALLAPIMMLIQTGHVAHFLFGFDTGWDPQRRDDGSIPFKAIVRRHRSHVFLGVLSLIAGLLISPSLVAWMSPTIAGLILAIFISWVTGLLGLGVALRRMGLLMTPEESQKPPVVVRANTLTETLSAESDIQDCLRALHGDQRFRTLHESFLPPRRKRKRGEITPEWALAEAKLDDAETLEEALVWLNPKERMALLHDKVLIERLALLPPAQSEKPEAA